MQMLTPNKQDFYYTKFFNYFSFNSNFKLIFFLFVYLLAVFALLGDKPNLLIKNTLAKLMKQETAQ
jgi:hypothetical protein